MSIDEISAFLSALAKVYRASPNTVSAYRGDLADFSRFLGDCHRLSTPHFEAIVRY
jgi:site-specific recombinase XerD